jgi:uncharacterized protein YuzE
MAPRLTLRYDPVGDILFIDKVRPYPEQDSEELEDEVIVRMHPETGEIENLEILFYTARLRSGEELELPVEANLRLAE